MAAVRNLAETLGSSGILSGVRALAHVSLVLALIPAAAFAGVQTRSLTVVIDPGHGGAFPHDGAHGHGNLVEKNIALAVSEKLKALLEGAGASVVLTRSADLDVPLAQRAQVANEANGDLFLSIHCNSMETWQDRLVTRGIETYFLSPDPTDAEAKLLAELENGPEAVALPRKTDAVSGILADLALSQARNDSAVLAQIIQRKMVAGTKSPSRGVRQAPFLVLSGTKMPSALVEIGFISHPLEGRLLAKDQYQDRIAQALASAVEEFADKVLARRLMADADQAKVVLPELTLNGKARRKAADKRPGPAGRAPSRGSTVMPAVSLQGSSRTAGTASVVIGALSIPVAAAASPR
jgi:N-acetylmuramoyl-L-alanine amidase